MDVTDRLIEAATKAAVDDNRYEYAQALAQIATARTLAAISESLAQIAEALPIITGTVENVSFDPEQIVNAVRTSPWQ